MLRNPTNTRLSHLDYRVCHLYDMTTPETPPTRDSRTCTRLPCVSSVRYDNPQGLVPRQRCISGVCMKISGSNSTTVFQVYDIAGPSHGL
ncbi:hypothetical protein J6590_081306 [Homalodisca vitripennis]|nr:hypothetical protein J6590_081306 [Homalodisca vitripennis]